MTQFTYDTATNGVGKMATAAASDLSGYTGGAWTWSYSYDILGNVNGQTLQTPFTAQSLYGASAAVTPSATYTYDSDSKLTGMVAPGLIGSGYYNNGQNYCSLCWQPGNSYQYTYDTAGRPTGMNQWDTTNQTWDIAVTGNGTHNAAGQLTGWQEGYNALTRSYDPARGWLTGLTAGPGFLNMQYSYNSNGQATTVTDSINSGQGVTSYTYDNLDRLSSATTPKWSASLSTSVATKRAGRSGPQKTRPRPARWQQPCRSAIVSETRL